MGDFIRDLRYGFRQLHANPGFTIAAVLCLALGIGANSAAFGLARSTLFPDVEHVEEPGRLVRAFLRYDSGLAHGSWSWSDLRDLRERPPDVLTDVSGEAVRPFHVSVGDHPRRAFASFVTDNYFDLLGVEAGRGRTFRSGEDEGEGGHPVLVLSHAVWERDFGADPGAVGDTLEVNGRDLEIVGVAPAGFSGTNVAIAPEFWVPFSMQPTLDPTGSMLESRGNRWIGYVTGRMAPGATPEQVKAGLDAFYAELAEIHPDTNTGITVDVYRESEAGLHPAVRSGFVGLMTLVSGVVGFVLLLACANVAGLLLARATSRRREIGIRLALGAGRGRLVRQVLTESLVLALVGGILGLLLARALVAVVSSIDPPTDLPLALQVEIDPTVMGATFLITLLTGVAFGLLPALQASRRADLTAALKEGTRGAGTGGGVSRSRQALVVGQVALCLVLLIGAGMALRSLQNARSMKLGLDPEGVAMASVDPALQGVPVEELRPFYDRLRRELAAKPGVAAVGLSLLPPLMLQSAQRGVLPEGFDVPEGSDRPAIDYTEVDHGYFEALAIPALRGRLFHESDDADSPPVAVINEAFAERFWPGESPVGKRMRTAGVEHEVIGVVPTGKYFSLGEVPKPYFYLPFAQRFDGSSQFLFVRVDGDPSAFLPTLRRTVEELIPGLPVNDLAPMPDNLAFAYAPARVAAIVVASFAVLALLLAAVGLYGVISYTVARGIRQIGIRRALGARAEDVVRLVLRQGLVLVVLGLVIGMAAGHALSRVASSVLYGVSATDPVVYGLAVVVLLGAASVASLLPARRATRVDPLIALRAE